MSRLDDLPPDQRATLSLLLRSRKSYAEVATLLSIQQRAVHDRAHAALAVLAARQARELTAERREEIGDYLLGQRAGVAERLATRTYLQGSPQARAWASALAAELEPLAGSSLPEIPDAAPAQASAVERGASEDAPPAATPARGSLGQARHPRTPASSRRGGALLLAAIVAVVVVAVILIADGGGSSGKQSASGSTAASGAGTSSTGTASGTSSTSSTSSTAARAKEDKRITLRPADPSSKSIGVAEVLSEGSKYAFYLAAEHLPPSKGFFYAVWLYNSPTSFEALSKSPAVGANGRLQGGALLPSDAAKFHRMLLTKETNERPTRPGPIVLSGSFALH
jgi:hypothetical protein